MKASAVTERVYRISLGMVNVFLIVAPDGLTLIDVAPRKGGEGPVAFVHPKSCHGVLVELIEAPGGPAWSKLEY